MSDKQINKNLAPQVDDPTLQSVVGDSDTEDSKVEKVEKDNEEIAKQEDKQTKSAIKDVAVASAVAPATFSALNMIAMTKLLQLLLMKLLAALKVATTGILGKIVSAVMSAAASITKTITTVVSFVSNLFSVSTFVAGVTTIATSFVGAALIIGGIVTAVTSDKATDSYVPDCEEGVIEAVSQTTVNPNGVTLENAKKTYSVLHEWGMSDNEIAGILGNWSWESGIDTTGVETIYGEKYIIGPKKQHAIDVGFDIHQINPSYANEYPTIVNCGIGLGQWTNSRNINLVNYAKSINKPWYTIDTQLAFMIGIDGDKTVLARYRDTKQNASLDECTTYFLDEWERTDRDSLPQRKVQAAMWALKFPTFISDVNYASGIISAANSTSSRATNVAVELASEDCGEVTQAYNNSTLAVSAVSYAYPTKDQGVNNKGTALYQQLHDTLFPGDEYYMSCDRSVACAVRWSGYDDTFPKGNVANILAYLKVSPKWAEVSWTGKQSELLPGDIMIVKEYGIYDSAGKDISRSHVIMYTGNDAIKMVYPDAANNLVIVSGSIGTRSPGCGTWSPSYSSYRVFRNIKKEDNPQYTSIAANVFTNIDDFNVQENSPEYEDEEDTDDEE